MTYYVPYLILFIVAAILRPDYSAFVVSFLIVFVTHLIILRKIGREVLTLEDPEVGQCPTAIIDQEFRLISKSLRFDLDINKADLVIPFMDLKLSPVGKIKKFFLKNGKDDRILLRMKMLPSGNFVIWIDDRDQLDHDKFRDPISGALSIKVLDVIDHPGAYGVIYVDIVGLDNTNQAQGFMAGNNILKTTANMLRSLVRDCDYVIRVDNDEFAVIMENAEEARVKEVMEKIKNSAIVQLNCLCVVGLGSTIAESIKRAKSKFTGRSDGGAVSKVR